jgi:hypothetical protein
MLKWLMLHFIALMQDYQVNFYSLHAPIQVVEPFKAAHDIDMSLRRCHRQQSHKAQVCS